MHRSLKILFFVLFVFVLTAGFWGQVPQRKMESEVAPVQKMSLSRAEADSMAEAHERQEQEVFADSIIGFARQFMGLEYYYTGKVPETGFDCSGFTSYVYGQFGIEVSPASREQIYAGVEVPLQEASKGDLLVFTGTNLKVRKPGHVGIVISRKGELPVRFIHSSSNVGVKISKVQGTRYAKRLLQVRRVIEAK